MPRPGRARLGKARRGMVRRDMAWLVTAGVTWWGTACPGREWQITADEAG